MILFYDTETTGLYRDRLPFDHPDQPRLVQIAAMLTDDDGKMISQISLVVNPNAFIPPEASNVHGIDSDFAEKVGVQEKTALGLFNFMSTRADLSVAHNIKFDDGVMGCVAARAGNPSVHIEQFCTMEAAAPIVNLPPSDRMVAAGFNKPKPPKLEECIQYFFGETLEGAHDAFNDLRACARIYFHLKTLEKRT